MSNFILSELPPQVDLETKAVLKQALTAHQFLAGLKGEAKTIPNQGILVNTLPLLEAKDSSAMMNYTRKISLKNSFNPLRQKKFEIMKLLSVPVLIK